MVPFVAIVDYGMANLLSVESGLRRVGCRPEITSDPAVLYAADAVVFPGVGAFGDAVRNLHAYGLFDPLCEILASGKPFLGICLGLQLLFETSTELGSHRGLGFIKGSVVRFPEGLTIPHMGWNQVHHQRPSPLFDGIKQDEYFYFVHSYYPVPDDEAVTLATSDYGLDFCCAIQVGNVFATQFHPEKSQRAGRRLLENFKQVIECS